MNFGMCFIGVGSFLAFKGVAFLITKDFYHDSIQYKLSLMATTIVVASTMIGVI